MRKNVCMLQRLREFERVRDRFLALVPKWTQPVSNFDQKEWDKQLKQAGLFEKDSALAEEVMEGVRHGFGLRVQEGPIDSAKRNLPTTLEDDIAITKWLLKAYERDWLIGPFTQEQVRGHPDFEHVNKCALGCVPKPSAKSGVRPIWNLSGGRVSVNDRIKEVDKKCKYTRLRDLAKIVDSAGETGTLWVADAQDAYMQLRVKPCDRWLLGVEWQGRTIIFCSIVFGLASAPLIYTRFGDALEFIIAKKCGEATAYDSDDVVRMVRHYIEDFFGGAKELDQSWNQFRTLRQVWSELAVPHGEEKLKGPAEWQKILGIIWSCKDQTASLPEDKRKQYMRNIRFCLRKEAITIEDLQSLVGKIRWAATAVFGVQAFIRRLELVGAGRRTKKSGRRVRLTAAIKTDLQVCLHMLQHMRDGIAIDYILSDPSAADVVMYSDASSKIGAGGVSSEGQYFQIRWTEIWPEVCELEISAGEMIAAWIMFTCTKARAGARSLTMMIDNMGVMWNIRKKSASRNDLLFFVGEIVKTAFSRRQYFWTDYVDTKSNATADALSRFEVVHGEQKEWLKHNVDMAEVIEVLRSQRVRRLLRPRIKKKKKEETQ